MGFFKDDLRSIKAFIFDVDGVLSHHDMNLSPEGELIRTSCAKDGYALMYSIKKGYIIAVISGGGAPGIKERLNKLGISEVYLKKSDKLVVLQSLIEKYNLKIEEIMYMGDDIPDYTCMKYVGMPVCPYDACEEIKSISRYISEFKGGEGCVRDVISQVLKVQGKWMDTDCHVRSM